jgi:hypothetical protein
MKAEQITEALEQAAGQLGIKVRYEAMTGDAGGAGGLCKIHGQWTVLVDRRSTPSDRAAVLAEALAGFDIESVYLPPQVREAVLRHRPATQPTAQPETTG